MNPLRNIFKKYHAVFLLGVLERARKNFSPAEELLAGVFAILLILGAAGLLYRVNEFFLSNIPASGGEFSEGIIGNPRFLNPLLALSNADRDLASLVYSGLLKATPTGELIADLASSYEISEDGRAYTFTIREEAEFHDGVPVLADDVLFTIQKAQDPALKSPKRANWEGVTAEKINERTVKLNLRQPYSPFLENATLGILPKHLWKDADADQFPFSPKNLDAVGSGPYKVNYIKRNDSGIPVVVELTAWSGYALGSPYIKRITFRFYPNEKELLAGYERGEIESMNSITPETAKDLETKGARVERSPLPRVFAVFFNQNQSSTLADKSVREALQRATDKQALVDTVLHGYGVTIDGPVPPRLLDFPLSDTGRAGGEPLAATTTKTRIAEANAILDRAKWMRNAETGIRERTKSLPARGAQTEKEAQKLSFSLVTSDVPELRESAELIRDMWSGIGAEVRVQIFESGDLNQNVIRPRKFDALLFGEIIGRDLDLFAFWHSSQRNDPGLNIAMYTNAKVDKLLDDGRKTTDADKRVDTYQAAVQAIQADTPAVFLYSPDFIYVLPEKIKGFEKSRTATPSERFIDIHHWYINTEKVWNVFAK